MNHTSQQLAIGYVLSQFPTLSETFIVEELLELKRLGVKFTIFSLKTPRRVEPISSEITELMPLVYYSAFLLSSSLLNSNLQFLLRHPADYVRLVWGLFASLVSQPIELVKSFAVIPKTIYFSEIARAHGCARIHAHFCNVPAAAAHLMAQILGVPFSCTAHGSDIYQYPPVDLVQRIQDASPFITISEYNRCYLKKLSPTFIKGTRIKVVHCGINVDKFKYKPRVVFSERIIQILTVARLEHVKGVDVLIDACLILRNALLDFSCIVVGDGSERAVLNKKICRLGLQHHVHLVGALPHRDVIQHYHLADLFVLPSRREGIPVSVMEAMATGLPVIATEVTGLPEIVDNGDTGILVPPENASLLADAIFRLAKETDIWERMSLRGRKKIEEEFNIKVSGDRLLTLWNRQNDICG